MKERSIVDLHISYMIPLLERMRMLVNMYMNTVLRVRQNNVD